MGRIGQKRRGIADCISGVALMCKEEASLMLRRSFSYFQALCSRFLCAAEQQNSTADELSRLRHELAGKSLLVDDIMREVQDLKKQLNQKGEEISTISAKLQDKVLLFSHSCQWCMFRLFLLVTDEACVEESEPSTQYFRTRCALIMDPALLCVVGSCVSVI